MSNFDGGANAGSSGGGPGGYSWWVWIGGGCAIIFVIISVVLAFGAYKGITCCTEAIQKHQKVQTFSMTVAEKLRDGEDEWAYEHLSESYRSRTTRDEFIGAVDQYRDAMDGALPEVMGVNRQIGQSGDGESGNYWKVNIGYLPNGGDTKLVTQLRLVAVGEGKETEFRVDDIRFERQRRSIGDESAVRIVRQFVTSVPDVEREGVRSILVESDDESDASGAWAVVESDPEIFKTEDVDLTSVRYELDGRATIDATHALAGGESRRVRYHLRRSNLRWAISDIELDIEPSPAETETEEPEPGASSDTGAMEDAGESDTGREP